MKRQLPALAAAFLITIFVALVMSVVGVDAMLNTNSVDVSNSSAPAAGAAAVTTSGSDQSSVQHLQGLVAQYQQREQQYQQQLDQASQEIQQYQQVLFVLQSQGLIRIHQDGRIEITGSGN